VSSCSLSVRPSSLFEVRDSPVEAFKQPVQLDEQRGCLSQIVYEGRLLSILVDQPGIQLVEASGKIYQPGLMGG
jgi:hypothetical protein